MGRRQANKTEHGRRPALLRKILLFLGLAAGLVLLGQVSPAAAAAPTVSSVSPTSGPLVGGQVVTIKGKGMTGATAVKFDTVDATSFAIMSDTQIVAVVPNAPAAASAQIFVTVGGDTNTAGAKYKYIAPEVKSLSPAWATPAAGAMITITGTGLLGTVAADVKFGTFVALNVWVISDTQIVVESPKTTTTPSVTVTEGEMDVVITRNSVASAASDKSKFLYATGIPAISALSGADTSAVAAGADLTITGTQLHAIKTVYFGSAKVTKTADITLTSATSITVKVPTASNGPVDVILENASGQSLANLTTRFSYISTKAPKVTSISHDVFDKHATTGGGTFLVIGSGFTGVGKTKVTLKCTSGDVVPESATAVSDTRLIVTTLGSGTAETCPLEIVNPADSGLTVTHADAIRFI